MPRHDNSVLVLVNLVRAIIISLLISFSDLPSSVIKLPRFYDVTCSICCPSMKIYILGDFGFLLTTIALVFFILIFIPNCVPTSFILLVNSRVPSHSLLIRQCKIVVIRVLHVVTLHIDNMSENIFRV